jgi:hypothetical protein
VHDSRPERGCLGGVEHAVRDDDDDVADMHEVRGGPIDPDDATPGLAGNRVRLQPGAGGDVDDGNELSRQNPRRIPAASSRSWSMVIDPT